MKNYFGSIFLLSLLISNTACGAGDRNLPEKMPNKNVPVDQKAGEPERKQQTSQPPMANSPVGPVSAAEESDSDDELESTPPIGFDLAAKGTLLGLMTSKNYLKLQDKWVGSVYPACNFFLITALCEAGYCKTSKPFYRAAEFDLYLMATGFKTVTLTELKALFVNKVKFDAVLQKDNPVEGRPGHVMVATGYDATKDRITIAQGRLGEATHELKTVTDSFIESWQGGFTIFVRK